MLFDPRPKERREEIFDREKELESILNGMNEYPISLIIGIRRVGKSSLLKVALNEYSGIGIYMDTRRLYSAGSGSISSAMLVDEITRILLGKGRVGFLRGIKVEEINLLGLHLKPRNQPGLMFWIGWSSSEERLERKSSLPSTRLSTSVSLVHEGVKTSSQE